MRHLQLETNVNFFLVFMKFALHPGNFSLAISIQKKEKKNPNLTKDTRHLLNIYI